MTRDRRRPPERSRRHQAGPDAGDARGRARRTHPGSRADAAARRSASGRFAGLHEVHYRCTRGQSSDTATGFRPVALPEVHAPGCCAHEPSHRLVSGSRFTPTCAPAGITHRIRFSGEPGAVDRELRRSAAHRSRNRPEPWLLHVCSDVAFQPGSSRYHAVPEPALVSCISAGTAMKSQLVTSVNRTEQRTLNPRVRGSSPWRRTRYDLGLYPFRVPS